MSKQQSVAHTTPLIAHLAPYNPTAVGSRWNTEWEQDTSQWRKVISEMSYTPFTKIDTQNSPLLPHGLSSAQPPSPSSLYPLLLDPCPPPPEF